MSVRRVYFFGETPNDQPANSELCRKVLGGKGISLAAMIKLGMPVPLGFTITCQTCVEYQETASWPAGLKEEVATNLKMLEEKMGKTFGDNANPLLVSVRSGAAVSMPGMMDTILNLGLNDESVKGLAAVTGNPRFAYDSYRRFMQMFGDVCLGIDHDKFEHALMQSRPSVAVRQIPSLRPMSSRRSARPTRRYALLPQERLSHSARTSSLSWLSMPFSRAGLTPGTCIQNP